ncbi:hypothetical protein [Streptomyces anatolicus]|nr:hypothetical protein [Streptomyces anatolicus]
MSESSVELAKMWSSKGGATMFIIVFVVFAIVLVALLMRNKNRR